MKKERYQLLDIIRGGCLISMVMFHTAWNLVYIYGVDWDWFGTVYKVIWQQSICWTFILLAGFCLPLGSNPVRRGTIVFGGGALIMAVTLILMPEQRIVFGVLTLIGSSMIIVGLVHKLLAKHLNKTSALIGATISFLMFAFTYSANYQFVGFFGKRIMDVPEELFQNYFTTYLGFPYRGFYSTDYFPIIPWMLLFLTGYFAHFVVMDSQAKKLLTKGGSRLLAWIGRHSLLVYMLHQPVVYGVLWVVFRGYMQLT